MRVHIPFDTLAIAQRLREVGFQANQAEALVEALADLVYGQVATKQDLELLESRLEARMEHGFADQLKWIIGIGVTQTLASIGGIFALFKFALLPGIH
jgi:hypothetical protein